MEISANDNLENEELMEVNAIRNITLSESSYRKDNLMQANVLLMNLSTDRIRLTAGGLFTIGKSLIPTVILNLN